MPHPTAAAQVQPNGIPERLKYLWWVRVMDEEGKNEASQRALAEVNRCMARGEDFDITVVLDFGVEVMGGTAGPPFQAALAH